MITTAECLINLAMITKGADPHVASSSSGSSHGEVDTPSSSVKCVERWEALEDHCGASLDRDTHAERLN